MPNLTLPPPVPQRGDRATFSSRVDAFLTWMAGLILQLNAFLASLNSLAAGGVYSLPYVWNGQLNVGGGLGAVATGVGSASQSVATAFFMDKVNSSGANVASILSSLFVTGNTGSIKGSIRIQKVGDPSKWLTFDVTVANDTTPTYVSMAVMPTGASSDNPFVNGDNVMVFMQRSGQKGDTGPVYVHATAKFSERQSTGTSGGNAAANITYNRTFNTTEWNEIPGLSLSGNQFLFATPGTYTFSARVPGYNVGAQRAYLSNLTDGIIISGPNSATIDPNSASNATAQQDAIVTGKFTITSQKSFTVRHFVQRTSNPGLGFPVAVAGEPEIYSEVTFTKVS